MVHRWPHEVKAFYMRRDPQDERLALGVDVIAPEGFGEIVGGGERAIDLAFLDSRSRRIGSARGVRVVPRPAGAMLRAPRRVRHGHRAHGQLDLRAACMSARRSLFPHVYRIYPNGTGWLHGRPLKESKRSSSSGSTRR